MTPPATTGASQDSVEAEFLRRIAAVDAGRSTLLQAFPRMEDCVIEIGGERLLLHPGMRAWFIYSPIHSAWDPTGVAVGEATFILENGRVVAARRTTESARPAAGASSGRRQ